MRDLNTGLRLLGLLNQMSGSGVQYQAELICDFIQLEIDKVRMPEIKLTPLDGYFKSIPELQAEIEELKRERDALRKLTTDQPDHGNEYAIVCHYKDQAIKLREVILKIHNGPGNWMSGWPHTWAHKIAKDALEEFGRVE